MTQTPDLFTNVHKGIRAALFDACTTLGRTGDDADAQPARTRLREALLFVRFHGENEDLLFLPLLKVRAPDLAARLEAAHRELEHELTALLEDVAELPCVALYLKTSRFIGKYLEHMADEELLFEPLIRAAITPEELGEQGKKAIGRADTAQQLSMLGLMLPALPEADSRALLAKLPPALAEALRANSKRPATS